MIRSYQAALKAFALPSRLRERTGFAEPAESVSPAFEKCNNVELGFYV
jgi:hypothetical protein